MLSVANAEAQRALTLRDYGLCQIKSQLEQLNRGADALADADLSLANSCLLDRIAVLGNSGRPTRRDGDGM